MSMFVWDGKEVFERGRYTSELKGLFCVDTSATTDKYRYGKWSPEKVDDFWTPVPLNDFPKEFQMALILLGVV